MTSDPRTIPGVLDRIADRFADRDALVFAVMEGVAFSFADGVDVLDAAGARPALQSQVGLLA